MDRLFELNALLDHGLSMFDFTTLKNGLKVNRLPTGGNKHAVKSMANAALLGEPVTVAVPRARYEIVDETNGVRAIITRGKGNQRGIDIFNDNIPIGQSGGTTGTKLMTTLKRHSSHTAKRKRPVEWVSNVQNERLYEASKKSLSKRSAKGLKRDVKAKRKRQAANFAQNQALNGRNAEIAAGVQQYLNKY